MNKFRPSVILCVVGFFGFLLPACTKVETPSTSSVQATKAVYYCPMHPQITSDKPGDCSICGMRLVKREEAASQESAAGAAVQITPARQQLIGVKTSLVEKRALHGTIHASARVAYDPALYSAIVEYQQALTNLPKDALGDSAYAKENQMTVRAAKLRLRQLGLSEGQIAQAGRADYDPGNLLLTRAGEIVMVYADIYDYEAPAVKPGQAVQLTSPALAGRVLEGKVRSLDTMLNAETRTLRARIEVAQASGLLRPEMYLSAAIKTDQGERLAVPKSAVMPTGTRQVVFVEKEPGHFEPQDIQTGIEVDEYYEVLKGLKEGDQVVTSANFLIDSESKMKAAIQGAQEHQHP